MRVLIIGNSHSAAVCQALADGWRCENMIFDYYVIPGRDSPNLVFKDGLFFPRGGSSNLRTSIDNCASDGLDLSLFDVVLVSAVGLLAARKSYIDSGEHVLGVVRCLDWEGESSPISTGYMVDIIKERIQSSAAYQFCIKAREVFSGTILVQAAPFPAKSVVFDLQWFQSDKWKRFAELCDLALTEMVSSIGCLLPHPSQSLFEFGVTLDSYSRENDGWHMSANYGHLVLDELRKKLT